ncbi:hypothetical protein O181_043693 [Austropuccinia psidii MF-1]|uniref:Methyltransferase type 11 domain-containing protein n=1 Tax=Austropuccinia psidii MF-1 TaxID=1389203 RepID=A0A9Q3HFY0_9BASI|nr:hypothetical protein [Austropuccinia psidii MF-1]
MSTSYSDADFSVDDYLNYRPRYPKRLFLTILEFHHTFQTQNDHQQPTPQTKLAIDLGCGPGIATSELLPYFEKVIGIDESQVMLNIAKLNLPQIEFHLASAINLPMIQSSSVDLLTVATAAHWFPTQWWKEASRIVRPGGTVALWVYSERLFFESSLPNVNQLNQAIMSYVDSVGHYTTGNEYAANMYDTLPLPTPESNFGPVKRVSWNREGYENGFFMSSTFTIDSLRKRMHTYSPIYRWRQDFPSKVATQDDPVEQSLQKIKQLAGWDDSTQFTCGNPLTLLLMKKLQ